MKEADLQILWSEKEQIENPEIVSVEDDEFQGATTIEDYNKANPEKADAEVLIHVDL